MQLDGRVAVVTGGASGIGAACCRRFAREGARVVVADLDAAGAQAVAREVDGLAVPTDVGREEAVRGLAERARARFGRIDLFFSNAGIVRGAGLAEGLEGPGGPFAADADWAQSWSVNLMAHVYAARAVLPEMLARGEGYLVSTASAAGLLLDLGTLPYTVTKHAAVAFAEWLAVSYGERGIRVSCLCPLGVRTPMLEGSSESGLGAHLMQNVKEPEEVAEAVARAIEAEEFLILPHPETREYLRRKGADEERWLAGMKRLRARTYQGSPRS